MHGISLSSCRRYYPARLNTRLNQYSCIHAAFAQDEKAQLLVIKLFTRLPMRSFTLRPDNSLDILMMPLSLGFKGSVSFPFANQATGLWLLSRWAYLPLNIPTFPGHTHPESSVGTIQDLQATNKVDRDPESSSE